MASTSAAVCAPIVRAQLMIREGVHSAGAVEAHRARVQRGEQFGDAGVEGGQREDALVAEAREDPALNNFNANFYLCFIARIRRHVEGARDAPYRRSSARACPRNHSTIRSR